MKERPEKMVTHRKPPEPGPDVTECYAPEDYAKNACLDSLVREGHFYAVEQVIAQHGHAMGDAAHEDPMVLAIQAEEAEDE